LIFLDVGSAAIFPPAFGKTPRQPESNPNKTFLETPRSATLLFFGLHPDDASLARARERLTIAPLF
jgi:hypothetical protein